VQYIYQKELEEILPESKGIKWERHPVFTVENKNIYKGMVQNLSNNGCKISEELVQLFGFDGLVNEGGKVSFVNDDTWYHLPDCIREILNHNLDDDNVLSLQTIEECIRSTNRNCQIANVFILPLEDVIKKPELGSQYTWLGSAWSPIRGFQVLNDWQKKVDEVADIALWRDHLPELSIEIVREGCYENFYLVKDETVTPQLKKNVNIPIEKSFTLPKNQEYYRFPLQQGEGNRKLKFAAYLKSPAFPLKKDTVCKLQLTYTYGADDPYKLKFIPLDADFTEFKSIQVEWRSETETAPIDLEKLPVPAFPKQKSWSDFQKWENGYPPRLDSLEKALDKIHDIAKYGRIKAPVIECKFKEDGNAFCFIEDTHIHELCLKLGDNQELPQPGDIVSFYKIKKYDKFSGEDVCLGETDPEGCFLAKNLHNHVLTIWNNGRSLLDPDVPDHFRNKVNEGINCALSLYTAPVCQDNFFNILLPFSFSF
jgi:hypothetical protein